MKFKRIAAPTAVLTVGLGALWATYARLPHEKPVAAAAPAAAGPEFVSAEGVVEAASEEVKVGATISGRIREVRVREGSQVHRGELVAVLDDGDYVARVASTRAQLAVSEAELRRLLAGARDEERQESEAQVREAEAGLQDAARDAERKRTLLQTGDVARADAQRAERDLAMAQARLDAANERYKLLTAPPQAEDRAKAEANVALAGAQLAEAEAMLEKTCVRSPLDGIVLRRFLNPGEVLSERLDSPILSVGDNSSLRVRVDVDETDIAKVRVGQRGWVTAEAFGERKFPGAVIRVGKILGKKNVHSDAPDERVDTKTLEVMVKLDSALELVPGLRVDAWLQR
jgi:HlyD family secretion protein